MAEAGAPELLARQRVDPVVRSEHEPAGERRLVGLDPLAERALGAPADPVEGALQPASGRTGEHQIPGSQLEGGAVPLELGGPELVGDGEPAASGDLGADRQITDRLGGDGDDPAAGGVELDPHVAVACGSERR